MLGYIMLTHWVELQMNAATLWAMAAHSGVHSQQGSPQAVPEADTEAWLL